MSVELTTTQAAERLKTTERTVRLWCEKGRLKGARFAETPRGRRWLIPDSALKGFERPARDRTRKSRDDAEESVAKKRARRKDPTRLLKTLS